jgi:hypothetical protein
MNARKLDAAPASNLTVTLTVDQSPAAAFAAINDVRGWWSGEIDGSTDHLGDEFTYRYKSIHYSKQKITEMVPGKKVTWLVLESNLSFLEDKTEVRFTHVGLAPRDECFKVCSDAWGSLIKSDLRGLIATSEARLNEDVKGKRRPARASMRSVK